MSKQIQHLADLKPDPRNARAHTPRNIGMIEAALGEIGAARSIVIDEDGVVLAGNATIEAAVQAGIERVQVVRRSRVRRSKLYYLRDLAGKAARLKEKRAAVVPASGETPAEHA